MKLAKAHLFFWLAAGIYISPLALAAKSSSAWEDCNWLVTYRGRTYDLAPLTRESLSRPLEMDLRLSLARVPAANEHLVRVEKSIRDSKGQARLASAFVMAALLARIITSSSSHEETKQDFRIVSLVSIGFFGASALSSWRSSQDARSELGASVEAFNRESSQKIMPKLEVD